MKPLDKTKIEIIESAHDALKWKNPHKLTLKEGLVFTGFNLTREALVKTPCGSSKGVKGEWIVMFPDGNIYKIPNSLFKLMFKMDQKLDMVGTLCKCGGKYSKLRGLVACSGCGDIIL